MTTTTNTTTLADLVQRVRYRSDQENSAFVSDTEIEQYVQESLFELYDLLIESVGPQHFLETFDLTIVAGTATYPLVDNVGQSGVPLNIYKVLGVDVTLGNTVRGIRPFQWPDRHRYSSVTSGWSDHRNVRYALSTQYDHAGSIAGGKAYRSIVFIPTPRAVHPASLWYIPTPVEENDSGTAIHHLHFAHWDEYVVVDAAAKVLEKEESDPTPLLRRKEALRQRILWHANTMNVDDAGGVNDVVGRYGTPGPRRGEPFL